MTRFNTGTKKGRTTNRAGGPAFEQASEMQLVSILLTSFAQDQFYRSADDTLEEVRALAHRLPDKRFCAQAAVFARDRFGMRSITHALAAQIAREVKGEDWTRDFLRAVVIRPDDATETLSYYLSKFGKPIPNALKRGLGDALRKFDEYQIAKYRQGDKALSLVDAVNLCHPKPTDALSKLVRGTLKSADTWETALSSAGEAEDKEEAKSQAWDRLVRERKIGYFALLRNVRNIAEQAPDVLDDALTMLNDERLIHKSRVLPFRFMTAYEEIAKAGLDDGNKALRAIGRAMDKATANVPEFPGETLIAVDVSGSMTGFGFGRSDGKRTPIENASVLAAAFVKRNPDAHVRLFDTAIDDEAIDTDTTVGAIAWNIRSRATGGGTNFDLVFHKLRKSFDRILILSDMQAWISNGWGSNPPTKALAEYERRTGAKPKIFSFDLQGYGSMQFPKDRIYQLAGFSEKVFDVLKLLEEDPNALVSEIRKVEFNGKA